MIYFCKTISNYIKSIFTINCSFLDSIFIFHPSISTIFVTRASPSPYPIEFLD